MNLNESKLITNEFNCKLLEFNAIIDGKLKMAAENPKNHEYKLAPRITTRKKIASALAMMFIEKTLAEGGEVNFPSLGITLTREDLLGPEELKETEDSPTSE